MSLADKIVLMTNGSGAMIAEILKNPLLQDRKGDEIHQNQPLSALQSPDGFSDGSQRRLQTQISRRL